MFIFRDHELVTRSFTYPENVRSKILKSGRGGIKLRASDQKKSTLIEINVIPSNGSNLSPNNIKNKIANLNHQHCIFIHIQWQKSSNDFDFFNSLSKTMFVKFANVRILWQNVLITFGDCKDQSPNLKALKEEYWCCDSWYINRKWLIFNRN